MNTASEQNLQLGKWVGGAAIGAVVMYLLDPERGAARRAESRDKLRQVGRQTGEVFDRVVDDIGSSVGQASNSLRQVAGHSASALQQAGASAGGALRSTLGQSGYQADSSPSRIMQDDANADVNGRRGWDSNMRAAAMAGGGALGLYGILTQRSPMAMVLGLAGMALLARAAANQPLRTLVPSGTQARPVEIEKSVRIDAAPEQVYDLFANYENFPRFLSNVIEVRDLGNRRSHWVVKGPAGSHFQWNAVLSEHSRPHRLAWQSEPGAEVDNYGSIEFEQVGRGSTRVTVRMSYRPPAGVVGRAIASLFGNEPGQQMEEDLQRMKSLVERGSLAPVAQQASTGPGRFLH